MEATYAWSLQGQTQIISMFSPRFHHEIFEGSCLALSSLAGWSRVLEQLVVAEVVHLENLDVDHWIHRRPTLVSNPSQVGPTTATDHKFNTYFNIIWLSAPITSGCPPRFTFPHKNFVRISHLSHMFCNYIPSTANSLTRPDDINEGIDVFFGAHNWVIFVTFFHHSLR
jgi:hypothetical protein